MGEKLVELLIIEFFGITIAGGIIVAYFNDGAMPKRRKVGLLLSALIVIIGVCVRLEIPALSSMIESITQFKIETSSDNMEFTADMPWWAALALGEVVLFLIGVIYRLIRYRSLHSILYGLSVVPMIIFLVELLALTCIVFSLFMVVLLKLTGQLPPQGSLGELTVQWLRTGLWIGLLAGLLAGTIELLFSSDH